MTHVSKKGEHKLLEKCTYPLTGRGVVDRVITDLAVLDCTPEGFRLVEAADGVTADEVREKTGSKVAA